MKKDLIAVDYNDMLINLNFDQAEKYLKNELKKYNVVVTQETLKGCKTLSTDLNKIAGEIDTKRKAELATMTAPIKEFDASMKSLITLCKDGREKITKQIKVFEDETRAKIKDLLDDYLSETWKKLKVEEKFRTATIEGLVILSSMTANGNLTGKVTSAIKGRCSIDKQKQMHVQTRLLKLENASYKAGLATPLEEIHVRAFLHADEDVYERELKQLLDAEVKRQVAAKEKIEKETTERVQREAAAAEPVVDDVEIYVSVEPAATYEVIDEISDMTESQTKRIVEEKIEKPTATEGNTFHVIQARFEVSAPSHIPVDRIVKKLESVMKKAGITTLKEIKVVA